MKTLSAPLQSRLQRLLPQRAPRATETALPTSSHWHAASCIDKVLETPDTATYRLLPAAPLGRFGAGSHINIAVTIDGKRVTRTYSISSNPKQQVTFDITVKKVTNGLVSTWLFDHFGPGDSLEISLPAGDFVLPEQPAGKLLLLSAGSGITPVMAMLRYLVSSGNRSEIHFMHYARSPADVIFADSLKQIAQQHPNVTVQVSVETADARWEGPTGRVAAEHFPDLSDIEVYLCGPQPFMQAAGALLSQAGVAAWRMHQEYFTAAGAPRQEVASQAPVTFASLQHAEPTRSRTLLDEAERRGLTPEAGCRQGLCKSCRCEKVSGEVVNLLTGARSSADHETILPCVTQALGPVVIKL